ncbi:MAG TPA: hypothetical protein VF628_12425 [Allosphingosinicella sp.]|jgi:hypothetical protein
MPYSTIVLIVGAATIGALLIAQWRLIHSRPEHFRMERLRGGLFLAILFVSFGVLHWHIRKAEREPERCCLQVFEAPEPSPPPATGPAPEPPPAPPRPPS